MRLDHFDNSSFNRGRSWFLEAVWRAIEGLLFRSWIPGSAWRVVLLRMFGAMIGDGVTIKPHVKVKFPWKLSIGNHCWIGEGVWIDNLAEIDVGDHCCLSQGAYLCTGNHRWDRETFDLVNRPIRIEDQCWIGAMAKIAPGVTCAQGAVLTLGSTALADLAAWQIHSGVPAKAVKSRPNPNNAADA